MLTEYHCSLKITHLKDISIDLEREKFFTFLHWARNVNQVSENLTCVILPVMPSLTLSSFTCKIGILEVLNIFQQFFFLFRIKKTNSRIVKIQTYIHCIYIIKWFSNPTYYSGFIRVIVLLIPLPISPITQPTFSYNHLFVLCS